MFSPGTAKPARAARNSSQSRARLSRSMALNSSLGACPIQRRASGGPAPASRIGAAETIGRNGGAAAAVGGARPPPRRDQAGPELRPVRPVALLQQAEPDQPVDVGRGQPA